MLGASLAAVVVERNVMTYRRQWIAFVTGFFEPIFYLFSLGIGLGALVETVSVEGRTVSYAQFVAPALLASSAMNGAIFDSTYGMFFKLRYMHTYDAMLATPVGPRVPGGYRHQTKPQLRRCCRRRPRRAGPSGRI